MGNEVVKFESEKQMLDQSNAFRAEVENLRVTSQPAYEAMVQLWYQAKAFQESVTQFFEKMRLKTYEAYQQVLADRKKAAAPFAAAETVAKQRMADWERKQEEIARAKQAKLEVKADAIEERTGERPLVKQVENRAHTEETVWVDNWKVDSVQITLLAKAVAEGRAPAKFLEPNFTELAKFAQSTGGAMPVDGVSWRNDRYPKRSARK